MVKKKITKKIKFGMYWIGISIVVLTHLYMLIMGLPQDMIISHSILNLVAAVLIGIDRFWK